MNALLVSCLALVTFCYAFPSGEEGVILKGPSGIVTNHGPIGPAGSEDGDGGEGEGLESGRGWGLGGGWGHGIVLTAPIAVEHSLEVITKGGGTIGVSEHGAAIRGPPTAPVIVAGPSGKIAADGLWGPTKNVGLKWGHGW
ncbi:collagen alpha-2(I) chain-like [Tribolium madens]|uniref:collagen alpha-2(I) chain-like n=1 Tax=Tribolium madens TaxID=41895 RepID=UPI001CF74306|nr:collagen alpha-2(I) chain-like [Tribolium madens]